MPEPSRLPQKLLNATGWLYLAVVGLFVVSALYVLSVASWTTIATDQWRIYGDYLAQPFPHNVLKPQNGHRPVLPGVLYLLDLHVFGAQNVLLNTAGLVLVIVLLAAWSRLIWRDGHFGWPDRAVAVSLPWLLMLWLANMRVLGHGNESLHVFPVLISLFVGTVSMARSVDPEARANSSWTWMLFAIGAAFLATFCVGFGIIVWPVLILLAPLAGHRWKTLLLLVGSFAATLLVYTYVLPASDRVWPKFQIDPMALLVDAATWLGAPAYHAALWFPSMNGDVVREVVCPVLGAVGMVGTVGLWVYLYRSSNSGEKLSGLDCWTIGVLLFGAGCSFLVAVARGGYFNSYPGQVVAPRYLPWTCAFWIGGLLAARRYGVRSHRRAWIRPTWLATVLTLPILLLPAHHGRNYEYGKYLIEQAAIGLVIGAHHDDIVQRRLFRRPQAVYTVATYFKAHRLGPFDWPVADLVGRRFDREVTPSMAFDHSICKLQIETFKDRGVSYAHFTGRLVSRPRREVGRWLAVVGENGRIVGIGALRMTDHELGRALRLLAPLPTIFFGYVRGYRPGSDYRIFAFEPEDPGRVAVTLGQLSARRIAAAPRCP